MSISHRHNTETLHAPTHQFVENCRQQGTRELPLVLNCQEEVSPLGLVAVLLTPIPMTGLLSLMLIAAWTVHGANGFFIVIEGLEYNLVLAAWQR
jgi:hypothetical protein